MNAQKWASPPLNQSDVDSSPDTVNPTRPQKCDLGVRFTPVNPTVQLARSLACINIGGPIRQHKCTSVNLYPCCWLWKLKITELNITHLRWMWALSRKHPTPTRLLWNSSNICLVFWAVVSSQGLMNFTCGRPIKCSGDWLNYSALHSVALSMLLWQKHCLV